MGLTALIGYFSAPGEMHRAFKALSRNGFRRMVLVEKKADGEIRKTSFSSRLLGAYKVCLAAVLALLSGITPLFVSIFNLYSGGDFYGLPFYLSSATFTVLAILAWWRNDTSGVDSTLINDHSRWLTPGESVLILQAPAQSLVRPVNLLHEGTDIPPQLFLLHPRHERRTASRRPGMSFSPAQIVESAARFARKQIIDPEVHRSAVLLKRLRRSNVWARQACSDLAAARRLEQKASLTADWILDNEYILERNVRDVLRNLPPKFFMELPVLASDPYRGMPCIYALAKKLVSHTELRLDTDNILAFIHAYQSERTLTIRELWAVPQMLRIALIESIQNMVIIALKDMRERQLADFWANRLVTANQMDAVTLFAILAELTKKEILPSPYFSSRLIGLLYDVPTVLAPVQDWLERVHNSTLHDLNVQEMKRQTSEQLSCGNAFTSLRQLALLDWREMFEKLSRVERILRSEECGMYLQMDFATRNRCREAIEEIACSSARTEEDLAEYILKLASQTPLESPEDDLRRLVSTWLIGGARAELTKLLCCQEKLRYRIIAWIYRHHLLFYLSAVGLAVVSLTALSAGFVFLLGPPGFHLFRSPGSSAVVVGFLLLAFMPLSQIAIDGVNYFITRCLPPRTLPKMDFSDSGIPDEFRTLVVVPFLLVDSAAIDKQVSDLEICYLANKDDNLFFSLFSDFTDSDTRLRADDDELLRQAADSVEALNTRYGHGLFYLFHRERTWCESEQKYIGWERKRGKLEELNNLIVGATVDQDLSLVHVGRAQSLADIRFVITLDSDTRLPHAAARRLVETLAHPHNQPRFDASGAVIEGSYTIIQPRVSPTLESSSASFFSRLFSYPVGVDPYTSAVSDVYQDLSGEGSYHGKGIYDVRAFSRVLSGRFPEGRILSHDLIEGAYVRVGLASDIELYDSFPFQYQVYSNRSHRWIRGDWQIAGWLLPLVPLAGGVYGKNPLSLFNRWKIFDNLRRSLVPAANIVLLVCSWFMAPEAAGIVALMVGLQLLFHALSRHLTMVTNRRSFKDFKMFSLSRLGHDLLSGCADGALMPSQAAVSIDAVFRAVYRTMVSERHMLQWTSESTVCRTDLWKSLFWVALVSGSALSVVMGGAVLWLHPDRFGWSAPWLALWISGPAFGWCLNRKVGEQSGNPPLEESDLLFLRLITRRTWRFFSSFVNDDSNWLPPDNYQVAHQNSLAMRTSPTNIGLWMTSALGAYDSGYMPINLLVDKLSSSVATISRLTRYRGHLLNWYDITTLKPLEPRYVSTVDSGNLLGCLWALDKGLEEIARHPLLDSRVLAGMADTLELMRVEVEDNDVNRSFLETLSQELEAWREPPADVAGIFRIIRSIEHHLKSAHPDGEMVSWLRESVAQLETWTLSTEAYLGWIEILAEQPDEALAPLDVEIVSAIRRDLQKAPSLALLAAGQIDSIAALQVIHAQAPPASAEFLNWLDRLIAAFAKSQWLAGETLGRLEALSAGVRDLAAEMRMEFLYDHRRKLFAIGYNVSTNNLDTSMYDLLASEARLGSFVAIARGDVPLEHWFALGRLYGAFRGKRILLSWTGTMFEYLMPLLFQRSFPHSLLHKAVKEAVAVQVAYGRKHGVPWGFSESAFANLDLNKTYQYKAFGVAALSLKRSSEEQLVVSPYAAMLALSIIPGETVSNLRKMAGLGSLGEYGFFEAIDYSRRTERLGAPGVVVEAYMAHHQGMAFLALINFLHDGLFTERFHADSRVRAFEPLLQERIPSLPPLHLTMGSRREPAPLSEEMQASSGSIFRSQHNRSCRSLFLSNGRYGLMVTNNGSGYSQWGDFELTRWRADQLCGSLGIFCYLYEAANDRLWSATNHPTTGKCEDCSSEFYLDHAIFRSVQDKLHTEMEVIVSQEDDVELRRITVINRSSRERTVNLTSYVELSMAPHRADSQHPSFNKLFIQTEALPEQKVLLAYRRLRSSSDLPLVVAHCMFYNDQTDQHLSSQEWQFETDRRRFIGRGHTLADPMGARQDLSGSQGFVLDPALSVKRGFTLKPGEQTKVTLVLAASASREGALLLADKYSVPHAVDRAIDYSWRSAQQQLQVLQIQPDEARRFQQLAGHLLFPSRFMRASAKSLQENRLGQSGLWPYGISGDLPIVLVVIREIRDLNLIRQMLQAHTYWRMQGLSTDLVILNEEAGGYQRPLHERLEQMIQVYSLPAAAERGGSVFLLHAPQIPRVDVNLFNAVAKIVLLAGRGTLTQQLGRHVDNIESLPIAAGLPAVVEPSAPLPFMELHYFNSLGGFTQDGAEYAIYLGPGINTPAPWVNVIANPDFGTMVSETGSGFTWFGNSQRNRITGWSNDPVIDPASEAIYIRDEVSGCFWSPAAAPIREETAYRARHGTGYTIFEHNSHGIEQELTIFVPVDDEGGLPVKLQSLRLTNGSSRPRRLSVTMYAELTLGENRENSGMHIVSQWDEECQSIFARNSYHPEYGERVVFASVSPQAESYECDRGAFIGRNRSTSNPAAMEVTNLSNRTGAGLDSCAALRVTVDLKPNEVSRVICILGQAGSVEEARGLAGRFQSVESFVAAFNQTVSWWDELLTTIEVDTPELSINLLVNRWLQYQSLSCRIWGRSGFYQSGGAFGFRDQLQDVMAFLYVRPELARRQILLSASRQFREGDVQHWWHEPSGAGIRTRISDDLLWLPYVVGQYVKTTGDKEILEVQIPFLTGPELSEEQGELYFVPGVSSESASLFEHCRLAVGRGFTVSSLHGLPLIGTGDWNDGMNLVGAGGKGESVWLAWFLCDVLSGMAELAELFGDPGLGKKYLQDRGDLCRRIEKSGWDGNWYLRGTFDDGTPLGASANKEARIDALPQSWAWISGAADPERAEVALEAAWEHLVLEDERLVLLFTPPFETTEPSPGYIKGYPPGVRENGGQYTHAALWMAMAMARKGDGERAVKLLRLINPIEHSRDAVSVWRYEVEPYVVAADVYRLEGKTGHGGWSWYTGSAAWMYRVWIEEVMGLQVRSGKMTINPAIPDNWHGFSVSFRYGAAIYDIRVENAHSNGYGVDSVEMDGQRLADMTITLERHSVKHHVVVNMANKKKVMTEILQQAETV